MKTLKLMKKFFCYILLGLSLTPNVIADENEQANQIQSSRIMRKYSFEEPFGREYKAIGQSTRRVSNEFYCKVSDIVNFYVEILEDIMNILEGKEIPSELRDSLILGYTIMDNLYDKLNIYLYNFGVIVENVGARGKKYDFYEENGYILWDIENAYKYLNELIKNNNGFGSVGLKWRSNQKDILYFINNFRLFSLYDILKHLD